MSECQARNTRLHRARLKEDNGLYSKYRLRVDTNGGVQPRETGSTEVTQVRERDVRDVGFMKKIAKRLNGGSETEVTVTSKRHAQAEKRATSMGGADKEPTEDQPEDGKR